MKILLAGASGFIGKELKKALLADKHEVYSLVRKTPSTDREIGWDPDAEKAPEASVEGFDAWINLSGESIAKGRWTEEKKRRILESRVKSTKLLSSTINRLHTPPKVWINASAIGYYGNTGANEIGESAPAGDDFLADVVTKWEHAAHVNAAKTRLVYLRNGVVLGKSGGMLKNIELPFKLGFGGQIGDGSQYMSWIAIQDLIRVIQFLLGHPVSGPVNAVSPHPVTNKDFTKALGAALHRWTFLPMPAFAARLAFGEMADALLLSSCRAVPKVLQNKGFTFQFPDIQEALVANIS